MNIQLFNQGGGQSEIHFAAKAVVVDGVVAFVGSPNLSKNSQVNGELALKVTGGAVATEVYNQAWAEAQRVEPL